MDIRSAEDFGKCTDGVQNMDFFENFLALSKSLVRMCSNGIGINLYKKRIRYDRVS